MAIILIKKVIDNYGLSKKKKINNNYGLSRNIIKTITLFIDLTYQNIIGRPLKKKKKSSKIHKDIYSNSKIHFLSEF